MRTLMIRPGLLVGWMGVVALIFGGLATAKGDKPPDPRPVSPEASAFFETRVRPVLVEHA